jgi:hypothetical protein
VIYYAGIDSDTFSRFRISSRSISIVSSIIVTKYKGNLVCLYTYYKQTQRRSKCRRSSDTTKRVEVCMRPYPTHYLYLVVVVLVVVVAPPEGFDKMYKEKGSSTIIITTATT